MARWDFRLVFAGHNVLIPDVAAQWSERGSALKPGRQLLRLSVQVTPPFDFAAAVEAGHHPYTAYGAIERDGRVLLAGRVADVSFGERHEPVEMTLNVAGKEREVFPGSFEIGVFSEQQRHEASAVVVALRAIQHAADPLPVRLAKAEFTNIAASTEGVTHVVVFGAPGSTTIPGTPTYVIDTTATNYTFAVAGHRVAATYCHLWFKHSTTGAWTRNTTGTLGTTHVRSGGRTIATVDGDVSTTVEDPEAGQFYIDWDGGHGLDGRAGEVLRVLMGHSSMRVDWARTAGALERLNGFQLDGYVNNDVGPFDYINRQLLPILPCSLQFGAEGMFVEMWPWLDGGSEVAFALDADDGGFAPAGRVKYEEASATGITLDYAWDPQKKGYSKSYTADASSSYPPNISPTEIGEHVSMKSRLVWDDATAAALVETRLKYVSQPSRVRKYTADPDLYGLGGERELRVGMPVSITDAGVGWAAKLAWVDEIQRTGEAMSVTLRIREW